MLALKTIVVLLGLAFTLFGYFIYFRKKYNLINSFEADFKAGRKKGLRKASWVGRVCAWHRDFDRRSCPYRL